MAPKAEKLLRIPLAQLFPSPFNPRKTYGEIELRELAVTLVTQGQLAPIVVRPVNGKYEVLDGFRRLLAAPIAELDGLYAQVRDDLDDDAARSVVLIMNLQREALPPLDEAGAIAFLLGAQAGNPDALQHVADAIGKSPAYVARRARLIDLTADWKAALTEGRIVLGHALAVAPFPASTQTRAADQFLFESRYTQGGERRGKPTAVEHIGTVKALERLLQHLTLQLDKAPFDTTSETLHPPAGSCTTCPKRAGNEPTLFGDLPSGTCTDPQCYGEKVQATIAAFQTAQPKAPMLSERYGGGLPKHFLARDRWQLAGTRKCEHVTEAIMGDGMTRGTVVKVCLERDCKVHWERPVSEGGRVKRSQTEQEAERKRRKAEDQKRAVRAAIVTAIADKIEELPPAEQIRYLVDALTEQVVSDAHRVVCKLLGLTVEKSTGHLGRDYRTPVLQHIGASPFRKQVRVGVLLDLAMRIAGHEWGGEPRALPEIAKLYGVDVKAIERGVLKTLAEQSKSKAVKRHTAKQAKRAKQAAKKAAKK